MGNDEPVESGETGSDASPPWIEVDIELELGMIIVCIVVDVFGGLANRLS